MVAMHHPSSRQPLTREVAIEAFQFLHAGKAVQTLYDPTGPARHCFANVRGRAERDGGSMATGWLLNFNSAAAARNRNIYARFNLEAHAIWRRPDGQLVEVTEDNAGLLFLPHPGVRSGTNAAIAFIDDLGLAREWHVPGVRRLIVPIPLPGSFLPS